MLQQEEPENPLRRLKVEEISKFVVKLRDNLFEVPSQSTPGQYYVVIIVVVVFGILLKKMKNRAH